MAGLNFQFKYNMSLYFFAFSNNIDFVYIDMWRCLTLRHGFDKKDVGFSDYSKSFAILTF